MVSGQLVLTKGKAKTVNGEHRADGGQWSVSFLTNGKVKAASKRVQSTDAGVSAESNLFEFCRATRRKTIVKFVSRLSPLPDADLSQADE